MTFSFDDSSTNSSGGKNKVGQNFNPSQLAVGVVLLIGTLITYLVYDVDNGPDFLHVLLPVLAFAGLVLLVLGFGVKIFGSK